MNRRWLDAGIGLTLDLAGAYAPGVVARSANLISIGNFVLVLDKNLDIELVEKSRRAIEQVLDAMRTRRQLILVIDTSSSMQDTDPENLRLDALKLVSALADFGLFVGLVDFDGEAKTLLKPSMMGQLISPTEWI